MRLGSKRCYGRVWSSLGACSSAAIAFRNNPSETTLQKQQRAYWPFLFAGGERGFLFGAHPAFLPRSYLLLLLPKTYGSHFNALSWLSILERRVKERGMRGPKGSGCSGELRIKGSEYNDFISFHSWKDVPPVRARLSSRCHHQKRLETRRNTSIGFH